jgi:hypothetical protein
MPLMNSMGALKQQQKFGAYIPNLRYMYMYDGFAGSNYPNQNSIILGSYDFISDKFFTVNADNDFLTCFDDTSSIVFNTTNSFTYGYYNLANNGVGIYSGVDLKKVNFTTYNLTTYTGQLTGQSYKVLFDSSGNIITLSNLTVGASNYLLVGKFDSSGTVIWQTRFTIPTPTVNYVQVNDVCLDSSDNIYYCGELFGAATPTSIYGKIDSGGTLGYMKTETNIQFVGVKCIGTDLYFAMNNGSTFTNEFIWNPVSTNSPYVGIATASTGSFTKISQLQKSTSNTYRVSGINIDPSDTSVIFVYGFSSLSGDDVESIIFKLNSGLTTLISKRKITFTVNTVVNPTYTHNQTFITNLQYQSSYNTFYLSGTTLDFLSPPIGNPNYNNNFMFRATVDTDYTGTILNRTYNIGNLTDTVTVNNITTFTGTTFSSVSFTPAYTISTSSSTLTASTTYPTKVLL